MHGRDPRRLRRGAHPRRPAAAALDPTLHDGEPPPRGAQACRLPEPHLAGPRRDAPRRLRQVWLRAGPDAPLLPQHPRAQHRGGGRPRLQPRHRGRLRGGDAPGRTSGGGLDPRGRGGPPPRGGASTAVSFSSARTGSSSSSTISCLVPPRLAGRSRRLARRHAAWWHFSRPVASRGTTGGACRHRPRRRADARGQPCDGRHGAHGAAGAGQGRVACRRAGSRGATAPSSRRRPSVSRAAPAGTGARAPSSNSSSPGAAPDLDPGPDRDGCRPDAARAISRPDRWRLARDALPLDIAPGLL